MSSTVYCEGRGERIQRECRSILQHNGDTIRTAVLRLCLPLSLRDRGRQIERERAGVYCSIMATPLEPAVQKTLSFSLSLRDRGRETDRAKEGRSLLQHNGDTIRPAVQKTLSFSLSLRDRGRQIEQERAGSLLQHNGDTIRTAVQKTLFTSLSLRDRGRQIE
jgi:hypothetical protein